jgi:hypothetical protein
MDCSSNLPVPDSSNPDLSDSDVSDSDASSDHVIIRPCLYKWRIYQQKYYSNVILSCYASSVEDARRKLLKSFGDRVYSYDSFGSYRTSTFYASDEVIDTIKNTEPEIIIYDVQIVEVENRC